MAACFWGSTHHKLLVRSEDLQRAHVKDRQRGLTPENIRQIHVYFVKYIQELTHSTLPLLRQRVAASAAVFFRRLYLRLDFCEWDPRSVAPACVYLASKTEEAPLQAKYLVQYARKAAARYGHPPPEYDVKALLDLELALLDHLRYDLVVFSPYDSLQQLVLDPAAPPGEDNDAGGPEAPPPAAAAAPAGNGASVAPSVAGDGPVPRPEAAPQALSPAATAAAGAAGGLHAPLPPPSVLQSLAADAWGAVTDSYCTDVHLTHAPHAIALGSLVTAATLRGVDLGPWLAGLDVDLGPVGQVSMALLELYRAGGPTPVHPEVCQRYMDILQLPP